MIPRSVSIIIAEASIVTIVNVLRTSHSFPNI